LDSVQVDVRIDPCMFFTLHVQKSSVLRCARKYLFSCLSEPNCSQGACLHACSAKYFLIVYNFLRSFDQSDFLSHLLSIIMQASCFVKLRVPNIKTNSSIRHGESQRRALVLANKIRQFSLVKTGPLIVYLLPSWMDHMAYHDAMRQVTSVHM